MRQVSAFSDLKSLFCPYSRQTMKVRICCSLVIRFFLIDSENRGFFLGWFGLLRLYFFFWFYCFGSVCLISSGGSLFVFLGSSLAFASKNLSSAMQFIIFKLHLAVACWILNRSRAGILCVLTPAWIVAEDGVLLTRLLAVRSREMFLARGFRSVTLLDSKPLRNLIVMLAS